MDDTRQWRLATLNMLKGGGKRVAPDEVLRDTRADLLLLQEAAGFTSPASVRWVWQPVLARGWGSAIRVAHGRLEPLAVRGFDGWVAGAQWSAAHVDGLGVFSVHAPHGAGGYTGRMHSILDAIAAAARRAELRDIVIGGDFNIGISTRSHSGSARACDRAVQQRLCDQFGLLNAWDWLHPRMQPAQTLRWTGDRLVPYHCDGLFVPQRWAGSIRRCVVLQSARWRARSDHNPVVATLAAH